LKKSDQDLGKRTIDDLHEIEQSLKVALGVRPGANGRLRTREELLEDVVSLRGSVRKGIKAGRIIRGNIQLSIALPGKQNGVQRVNGVETGLEYMMRRR
jgi:hypothetical protein